MSIPRDLKVEIPGYGTEKFNAAFTDGGPKLTLQVVKELTGLPINHVVNVDFLGFVRAVDAIGCVYTDVDRRYYHSNVGVPPSEQYSEIDIKPGYQLLCGKRALEYVRYRHTDTDIVRSARQQDFLSAARQRVPIKDLLLGQNGLIDIFTHTRPRTSATRARDPSAGPVRRVTERGDQGGPLPGRTRAPATFTPRRARSTVRWTSSWGSKPAEAGRARRRAPPRERGKAVVRGDKHPAQPKPHSPKPKPPGSDGLVPPAKPANGGEAGRPQGQRRLSVFYPTRLPSGAYYVESNPYEHVQDPRVYHLRDTNDHRHGAYRMVARSFRSPRRHPLLRPAGDPGLVDPPILDNPSLTKTINGREYDIYVDGDRIPGVAGTGGTTATGSRMTSSTA